MSGLRARRAARDTQVRHTLVAWLSLSMLAACELSRAAVGPGPPAALPDISFVFRQAGAEPRRLSLRTLAEHTKALHVETDDPYYRRRKHFRAVALAPVLTYAYGRDAASLRRELFVLKATDGYAVPIAGERLFEEGAFIAFDDVEVPGFEPIGPKRASPSPAYLVWTRKGQDDLDTHPRPWQLESFELASFETLYPHTIPVGEASAGPAMEGMQVFRDHCIKCHAINREGGRVGPDLNVPRSIVEYRPEAQLRAYIVDPRTFRYGAMPAHPTLTDQDLDGLMAYFRAMATRKHDVDAEREP